MLKSLPSPCLILLQFDKQTSRFPLAQGTLSIGRERGNSIPLPFSSVSRQHAELLVDESGVQLRDLKSRNGIRVNGVPRQTAMLQEGDLISIGSVELLFTRTPVSTPPSPLAPKLTAEARLQETQRQVLQLPDAKPQRHLAAFYHLCAWITEGVDQESGLEKWLDLLLESVRAQAVHFYNAEGKLQLVALREGESPKVKFATYLLEKFRALTEASAFQAQDLDRFQQRLGHFHYLVAPLKLLSDSPECPVVVVLRPSDWEAFSPDDRVLLQSATQLWQRCSSRAQEVRVLKRENKELRARGPNANTAGILGQSEVLCRLRAQLDRAAATKATILVSGETGSGKEVIAHYLHQRSPRSKAPFIKVNCGAIPAGLIESELFGHVRGAFTDARSDHQGKFSLAHGGTLFLDEIGELPLTAQTKLLRAIESGEIERIGSEAPTRVDVRLVAATNRSLSQLVSTREFREDLYYRLNVVSVKAPPLREHVEDIQELANHFLKGFCEENGLAEMELHDDAIKALQAHAWPGNVRELRNVIQRVAIETGAGMLRAKDIHAALGEN